MFTIKAVSAATGVSIETLRAWERRYRVVEPHRDPNGRRSYQPEDVIRLRKLREATERGHTISKLARVSDAELESLSANPEPEQPRDTATRSVVAQMLQAGEEYSPEACDQALSMALALLPLSVVVNDVLSPVLLEVGERWHKGTFNVAQERLVTSSVHKQISSVIETYNRITAGPPIVLATVAGERHDLGILMCTLLAAARGVRCLYLGADVPAADIAIFCERVGAAAAVLSFVLVDDSNAAAIQLEELVAKLPEPIQVWVGGLATPTLSAERLGARVSVLDDFNAFERQLDMLAARR